MRCAGSWLLAGLLLCLAGCGRQAPEPPSPGPPVEGPLLPAPSVFDELVVVQAGRPHSGIGTAFAVNRFGDWLTARHVVEGCSDVHLEVAPGNHVPVADIVLDAAHDLALLRTGRSPYPVTFDLDSPLFIGSAGFHVGFPQGRAGELTSRLAGWSRLVMRGDREEESPILAWTETGRRQGPAGTLGGISGGPVFDRQGAVRGVIVAESPRRGQVYTAAPDAIRAFLVSEEVPYLSAGGLALREADRQPGRTFRRLQVVKVLCEVSG